jgi:hypothetical protein
MSPGFLETIFSLSCLIIFLLSPKALDQSGQRPSIVRMTQKIRMIDRFRFRRAISQQEHSPKMMPYG